MNMSIYTDGTYFESNQSWHEEDSPWKAQQISKILKKNGISLATVCEVGCGAGAILSCLANIYGENVVFSGYEISPQAYEICKMKEKNNIKFLLTDLLADREAFFDVVMAIDVFEHIEDYFGFLRKLREKGKYKIFHIPLDLSVQTVLRSSPILAARKNVGHIQYFTKETALATLKDAGYEIVDFCYTGGSIELENREWRTNFLRLPRKLFFSIYQDLAVRILGGYSLLVLTI